MKLSNYMEKTGLSVPEIAQKIGVSAQAVYKYLDGSRRPDWSIIHRIVEATNGAVTANDFMPEPPQSGG